MMGSSNGITRGQLRPHFSGRSPPFLLAALCVGLGILGVSYWSLSQQYNDLEEQLKKTLIKKERIERDLSVIQSQLTLREEEFSSAKQNLQKTENQLKTKTDQINDINAKVETLTKDNVKCSEDLNKKTNDLGDAVSKLKDIEQQKDENKQKDQNQELTHLKDENKRLEKELETLRHELITSKNGTKSDINSKSGAKENTENNMNDLNSLKFNNSLKAEESNKEMVIPDEGPKAQESVIAEPVKPNQSLPSNDLAEEDRKDDGLVEANETNNEIVDENKETEDFKPKSQIQK